MGTLALIGIGSNLGDRKAILGDAASSLAATPGIALRGVSSYHETAPVGGPPGQGAFLNASALLEVECDSIVLLDALQRIEGQAGRVRDERWGARTLDLDLLLFGDLILGRQPSFVNLGTTTPDLKIPHPWLPFRRFVLAPAAEIAPDLVDPVTRRTIAQLLANLDRRPSYLALAGSQGPRMRRLFRRITQELNAVGFSNGDPSWNETNQAAFTARFSGLSPAERERDRAAAYSRWDDARHEAFSSLGDALRADRWSERVWGDRWMVTDFWFDQWWWEHPSSDPRYLESRRHVIEPTFLALIPSWDRDFLSFVREDASWSTSTASARATLPPLFTHRGQRLDLQDPNDPDRRDEPLIATILAVCHASRAGQDVG